MQTTDHPLSSLSPVPPQTIAIAATFTAEPLQESLAFWMRELGIPAQIEFAPYNQVFQQLLDPASLFSQNRQGINVILIRFEDWQRFEPGVDDQPTDKVERNVQDLATTLSAAATRSATPFILCFCPASPSVQADAAQAAFFQQMENLLIAELSGSSSIHWLKAADFATYPVEQYYDSERDRLGHIPFTPAYFTALSTALARKIYAIKSPPYKVIVMDCDNTIWRGIVGEDGVEGISIPPGWQALQTFMVAQQKAGMVLCLCSKNNEPDVMEVFEQRSDMILKLEHLVAWRINWLPKSENIRSLAAELNLGLDSFIFIDDNPIECAEVQASCPDVLTLQLPIEGDIDKFLRHVWAFDHLKVTEEDKQRTELYKQNLERTRFQKEAPTIEAFLAGLELNVQISEPTAAQLPRVSQLTQRTNQFNFSTVRRSEAEIQQLAQSGLECRIVEVSDRFGEYGLVGVMIFGCEADSLTIDTFLLSCRVLGRGVEHQMLSHLGDIAQERHLNWVNATYVPSKKNMPARSFLESVGTDFKQALENGDRYVFPAEYAAARSYVPGGVPDELSGSAGKAATNASAIPSIGKSARLNRIAQELSDVERILASIAAQQTSSQRSLDQPLVAPRTPVETQLVELWQTLLLVDAIGIQDNYFDLGGTSLLAVELFAQIERQFNRKLPLTTLVEAPTIEQFAKRLEVEQSAPQPLVVQLHHGSAEPPLFLVHDGEGETLLYRNLARRLDRSVYGIQPLSQPGSPILHTRIPEMAAHYIQQIQTVQPTGPYLLGGMCAGGVIAFEMARQLQAQGQETAMVAIMDAADVEAPKQIGRVSSIRLARFSETLSQGSELKLHERLLYIFGKVSQKTTNLLVYEVQDKIRGLWEKVQLKLFRYCLDRNRPIPKALQNIPVRTVYNFAEQDYLPNEVYRGELLLLRATMATEGVINDDPYVEMYSDPLLGWEKRVTDGVAVDDMPGGHSSMLQEPNVEVMAKSIQDYLQRVFTTRKPSERTPTRVGR